MNTIRSQGFIIIERDPQTGRFTSKDPIGFNGGDINLYRYVKNQPTILTDPSGKAPGAVGSVWTGLSGGGNGNIIGSLVGGSIGSIAGPVGGIVGGAVGGAIGGTFDSTMANNNDTIPPQSNLTPSQQDVVDNFNWAMVNGNVSTVRNINPNATNSSPAFQCGH
ncbi:MAG: hypothetical protein PHY93_20470 [Bacteriovorax sp.]|nr:hypothetical protein [Bacteriovorax sp.]